jgi:hypothetical protein
MDKEPSTKVPQPLSQINMYGLDYPLHRNDLSNAPHQRVRQASSSHLHDCIQIFLSPPHELIQVGHPNISAHSPNQGIPNCYNNTSLNMHHLSHPQVYGFHHRNILHLNHQVIQIPFKELTATLRK